MSRFLNELDAWQKHLEAQLEYEKASTKEVTIDDYNYETLYAGGFVKAASFRLPVHLIAQLDELRSFTPYSTKAEMVAVMLQDRIEAFLSDASEDVKERFQQAKNNAVSKVTNNQRLVDFMNAALGDPKMYEKYRAAHDADLKEDAA